MPQGGVKVAGGDGVWQHGTIPSLAGCHAQHAQMRQHADESHEGEGQHRQDVAPASQARGFHGATGLAGHRVGVPPEPEFGRQIGESGAEHHHRDQRVGHRVVPHFAQPQIDLHGGHSLVVEHQRRAQFGEGPDEDQRAAREDAGTHQRQRQVTQFLPEARAVHRSCLVEADVNGLQASQDAEGHEGNRDKDADAAFPDEIDNIARPPVDCRADDAGIQQRVVQGAVFYIDDVFPHGGLDDQRRGPGKHNDGAGDFASAEIRVQDQGDDESQQG